MGFRIIERKQVSKDTRAYFTYNSFTEYFIVNLITNIIVFFFKLTWIIMVWTIFLPITLYLVIVSRIEGMKNKVIFSLIYIPIVLILFAILSVVAQ